MRGSESLRIFGRCSRWWRGLRRTTAKRPVCRFAVIQHFSLVRQKPLSTGFKGRSLQETFVGFSMLVSSSRSIRSRDAFWHFLDSVQARTLDGEKAALAASDSLINRVRALLWVVFAVGLGVRLSPLADIDGRLFWQFMTEDGYLMQTVARNMALGLGMSTSAAEIPTNGVQPLSTFLFAGLHWIADADRTASIALVTLLSALIASAAAYLLYRLARVLLTGLEFGEVLARCVAAIWFVGPLVVAHTMNGLETGLYMLMMLASLNYYLARFLLEADAPRWGPSLGLGLLLGLTFLARNDAVFFIGALLLAHLAVGSLDVAALKGRFVECLVSGVLSIVVGLPWLINNYLLFGTPVPISGLSQSFAAAFGENIALIPSNLLETMIPVLPIPRGLETNILLSVAALAFIAIVLVAYWRLWGVRTLATRRIFAATLLFAAGLSLYYGLFFGAAHFIPRYLSILSPLLWFALAVVGFFSLGMLPRLDKRLAPLLFGGAAVMLVFSLVLSLHFYRKGTEHMHKQVVEWVNANADPSDWVAAVQTGTLGYFHDRTLNLDGKVNPAALRELLEHGHVLDYVSGTSVRYIADWYGLSGWKDQGPRAETFNRNFELIVADKDKNLSVYRRRSTEPKT